MYLQKFGLNRSPFGIEPDPDFLWLGEMHKEGLSVLRYGILENKGFLLLTGEVGTGKTVLIRSLLTSLTEEVTVATIQDPSLAILDFFTILSHELGMASAIESKADFLIKFKKFVRRVYSSQKRLLVIIDEAQRLTNELLDEIRVLSNIDYENRKLANFFFVGQIEFNRIIMAPVNSALRQRITISYQLLPLRSEETGAYIRHRLKVAGAEKEIFLPEAVHEIFRFSKGTPRIINILCDRALITGYTRDLRRVSAEMIRECAKELEISSGDETSDINTAPSGEKPPPTEKKADRNMAYIKPFNRKGAWRSAAAIGAVGFIFFWLFFIRVPENNQVQGPISAKMQSSETRQPVKADPKDSSPSPRTRVLNSRLSKIPPDGGQANSQAEGSGHDDKQKPASEKSIPLTVAQPPEPLEEGPPKELSSTLPPRKPEVIEQSVALGKTSSKADLASSSIESKGLRFLLYFKPSSAELEDGSYEIMRQVSDFLNANPNAEVFLTTRMTQDDRPGLRSKLVELRVNIIRLVLAAQPKFQGTLTVVAPDGQGMAEDRELPAEGEARPRVEIRIKP